MCKCKPKTLFFTSINGQNLFLINNTCVQTMHATNHQIPKQNLKHLLTNRTMQPTCHSAAHFYIPCSVQYTAPIPWAQSGTNMAMGLVPKECHPSMVVLVDIMLSFIIQLQFQQFQEKHTHPHTPTPQINNNK